MFSWADFRHKFLWRTIGLLAIMLVVWVVSGWIYFGEPAAPLGLATRFNILLVLLFSFILYFFILSLWQKHAAGNIIDPAQTKSSEEITELKAKFADAIDILKNAKFDSLQGSKNLYELPWYLIIGNPGSGKTSAVLNSGLNFPLADRFGRNALSGLGGTRQCDWWFTNDAVFIDTAGRYTSQDSNSEQDRSAWQAFLGLLIRYRKRRPINGVIVTVSLQELFTATPDQRAHNARVIRARLDELIEQFNVPFPVYLMLTKLDLLAGFNPFFADLVGDDADQVWGFTLERSAEAEAPVAVDGLEKEINALLSRLNDRLLTRMQTERDAKKRALIVGFPQQFEILKPALMDFLTLTFAASRYTRQPQLRGLYLCSAKQEGAPIDRLTAAVAPQFGINADAAAVKSGKSYFLTRFFRAVLLPESELAGVNLQQEQKILWSRRGAYIGMGAAATLLIGVWADAITQHYAFVKEMQHRLAHIQQLEENLTPDANLTTSVDSLTELQAIAAQSDEAQHSWLSHLGMSDEGIAQAARVAYQNQLEHVFFPLLSQTIKNQFTHSQQDALYENLRVYLMLSTPSHREIKNLAAWIQRYYGQDEAHSRTAQTLMQTFFQQNPGAIDTHQDEKAIKNARAILLALPLPQRIYQQIRAENQNEEVDVRVEAGVDLSASFKANGHGNPYLMPKMFTKAGYQQINIADSINDVKKDRWMWGDLAAYSDENLAKTEDQVKALYFADYTAHWRLFLENIDLPRPTNLADSVALLRKLTSPDQSPLTSVLKLVSNNTTLANSNLLAVGGINPASAINAGLPASAAVPAQNALLDAVAKKSGVMGDKIKSSIEEKPNLVDLSFKPLNALSSDTPQHPAILPQLMQNLREAQDFLSNIASAPDAGDAALKASKARIQGGQDALQKLSLAVKEQPQPIQRWLSGVTLATNAQLTGAAGAQLNQLWRDQVFNTWDQKLAGRYPFVRNGRAEVSLRDFQEFFKVGGVLDKFVQENLASIVDPRRNFVSHNAESMGLSNLAVERLRRAYRIQAAFFASDPNQLKVEFRIKPVTMDDRLAQFTLDVGNQRVEYSHGPKIARDLSWPANNTESIRLSFEDLNQTPFHKNTEGEWAWLHVLDLAAKSNLAAQSMSVQFKDQSKFAEFEIALKQSVNAFDPNLLENFDCPRSL